MTEKVRYQVSDAIALITIARPEVRNAMDRDVFEGLHDAGMRAAADPGVRAVVVTGEAGVFSSGIDTTVFTGGRETAGTPLDIAALQRSFTVYEDMPKPSIAAVAGPAFGGGMQLALACDLRVAADDALFSLMEVRWGIVPDLGGTQRLPRLIGSGRAKEIAFSARKVDAHEAHAIGLVNRIVPAGEHLEQATAWAAELAGAPPLALAGIKRLVNGAFDTPVGAGLQREAVIQQRILASADFVEAVTARVQKRAPIFHRK